MNIDISRIKVFESIGKVRKKHKKLLEEVWVKLIDAIVFKNGEQVIYPKFENIK